MKIWTKTKLPKQVLMADNKDKQKPTKQSQFN